MAANLWESGWRPHTTWSSVLTERLRCSSFQGRNPRKGVTLDDQLRISEDTFHSSLRNHTPSPSTKLCNCQTASYSLTMRETENSPFQTGPWPIKKKSFFHLLFSGSTWSNSACLIKFDVLSWLLQFLCCIYVVECTYCKSLWIKASAK